MSSQFVLARWRILCIEGRQVLLGLTDSITRCKTLFGKLHDAERGAGSDGRRGSLRRWRLLLGSLDHGRLLIGIHIRRWHWNWHRNWHWRRHRGGLYHDDWGRGLLEPALAASSSSSSLIPASAIVTTAIPTTVAITAATATTTSVETSAPSSASSSVESSAAASAVISSVEPATPLEPSTSAKTPTTSAKPTTATTAAVVLLRKLTSTTTTASTCPPNHTVAIPLLGRPRRLLLLKLLSGHAVGFCLHVILALGFRGLPLHFLGMRLGGLAIALRLLGVLLGGFTMLLRLVSVALGLGLVRL
jgi:hypothetical protein